jgi:V/A-type H+-transporting ATPase subunit B
VAIIGEAALSDNDRRYLGFAEDFERRFIHQGGAARSIDETLTRAWELLEPYTAAELKRIHPDTVAARRAERVGGGESGEA